MFSRPPTGGRQPQFIVNERDGLMAGARVAGRRTATGWTAELLIPWSAAPGFSPKAGAEVGLQFELDDYDSRDAAAAQPRKLTVGAERGLWNDPRKFIKFVLVGRLPTGPQAALWPMVAVDVPAVSASGDAVPLAADVGSLLAARTAAVRLAVVDAAGKGILEKTVKPKSLAAPWRASVGAAAEWPARKADDGYYTVRAALLDGEGRALGHASRPVLLVRRTLDEIFARLKPIDVGKIARSDPWRAGAYMGVGVAVERLKRAIAVGDRPMAAHSAWEPLARLDVLAGGRAPTSRAGLVDLLALASDAEAQVAVQYADADAASVTFYCGAAPLAAAGVSLYETDQDAKAAFEPRPEDIYTVPQEALTVGGLPAARSVGLDMEFMDRADYAPSAQVLALATLRSDAYVFDISLLSWLNVDAAVVLPGCPKDVRDRVEARAAQAGAPLMDLTSAIGKPGPAEWDDEWEYEQRRAEKDREKATFRPRQRVLVAGPITGEELDRRFKTFNFYAIRPFEGTWNLNVLWGDRLVRVFGPSKRAAEDVARLVTAGRPVSPADTDAVRAQLVKELAPKTAPAAMPDGTTLYVGDLHMHTFYTDGRPSPAGLAIQTIYCRLDFAAMAEHNTLSSALAAKRLLAQAGIAQPLIVGEEITTTYAHFCAWPLRDVVDWTRPAYEVIRQAHMQGAAVQWNHPGFPPHKWQPPHMKVAGADLGTDAWEHAPSHYDQWKREGRCPLVTGTSDTHDGTFSDVEATVILAPSTQGEDLAEAFRWRRVAAIITYAPHYLYGPDDVTGIVWAALADGKTLKDAKRERLRDALKNADLAGLLRASPAKPAK
jgi:hypothetical protein